MNRLMFLVDFLANFKKNSQKIEENIKLMQAGIDDLYKMY